MKNKNMKEKPEVKKEKPQHKIELEQRPNLQEGEHFEDWIKRVGGPYASVEKLGECACGGILFESIKEHSHTPSPEQKKNMPMVIFRDGRFFLNSENIGEYFNKEKIDGLLKEKNPNITSVVDEYWIKKELFQNPDAYFEVIHQELKRKMKIVVEKGFENSVITNWSKPEEKPKKKLAVPAVRPEERVRAILEKQKKITELEGEMEKLQTAYAPLGWFRKKPALRDLGYYANQNRIEEIKKEIERLKVGTPAAPEKPKEKTKPKKKVEEKTEEGFVYKLGKKIRQQKPKEIFKKIIDKTKTGIDSVDKLGKKQRGPGLPEEVEEDIGVINNRLKYLHSAIRKSSVLERSGLEKEQRILEKRLKKLKKKKK